LLDDYTKTLGKVINFIILEFQQFSYSENNVKFRTLRQRPVASMLSSS